MLFRLFVWAAATLIALSFIEFLAIEQCDAAAVCNQFHKEELVI